MRKGIFDLLLAALGKLAADEAREWLMWLPPKLIAGLRNNLTNHCESVSRKNGSRIVPTYPESRPSFGTREVVAPLHFAKLTTLAQRLLFLFAAPP